MEKSLDTVIEPTEQEQFYKKKVMRRKLSPLRNDKSKFPTYNLSLQTKTTNKKFKSRPKTSLLDNSSYFILKKSKNDPKTYDLFPIKQWYDFQAEINYVTLDEEAAEKEFIRRHKILDYYNLMMKNRIDKKQLDNDTLQNDLDKYSITKNYNDDDETSKSSSSDLDDNKSIKNKVTKSNSNKNEPYNTSNNEDEEENEFESKELDYMSDSSSSSAQKKTNKDQKIVDGLERQVNDQIFSDSSSSIEENKSEDDDMSEEESSNGDNSKVKSTKEDKNDSSDFDDEENFDKLEIKYSKISNEPGSSKDAVMDDESHQKSKQSTKRMNLTNDNDKDVKKKTKIDHIQGLEESIKMILRQTPMTSSQLMSRLAKKFSSISNEVVVEQTAKILNKLQVKQSMVNKKLVLSL